MEYFLNLRSESNQFTWATLRVKLSFELALLVRACVCLQGVGWYQLSSEGGTMLAGTCSVLWSGVVS
jgi:hypothetical protein